jgi:uncharacterized protein
MSVFADSSALVKLYADEVDSAAVRAIHGPFRVCALARVEVPAALARKHRAGELTAADVTLLTGQFVADFHGTPSREPLFTAVAATGRVLINAAELAIGHGLRAYDAVQLASAVIARQVDPACDVFICFDAATSDLPWREPVHRYPNETPRPRPGLRVEIPTHGSRHQKPARAGVVVNRPLDRPEDPRRRLPLIDEHRLREAA